MSLIVARWRRIVGVYILIRASISSLVVVALTVCLSFSY